MTVLVVVLAAAVGGVIRWAAVEWWPCAWQAVLAVNVAGSGVLGWLVATDASATTITVVGIGFAGSLTTFSAFIWEARRSTPGFGVAYIALMLVGCIGAASVGAAL